MQKEEKAPNSQIARSGEASPESPRQARKEEINREDGKRPETLGEDLAMSGPELDGGLRSSSDKGNDIADTQEPESFLSSSLYILGLIVIAAIIVMIIGAVVRNRRAGREDSEDDEDVVMEEVPTWTEPEFSYRDADAEETASTADETKSRRRRRKVRETEVH